MRVDTEKVSELKRCLEAALSVIDYEIDTFWGKFPESALPTDDEREHARDIIAGSKWFRANLDEIIAAAELDKRENIVN